jgi:hypothetical protein
VLLESIQPEVPSRRSEWRRAQGHVSHSPGADLHLYRKGRWRSKLRLAKSRNQKPKASRLTPIFPHLRFSDLSSCPPRFIRASSNHRFSIFQIRLCPEYHCGDRRLMKRVSGFLPRNPSRSNRFSALTAKARTSCTFRAKSVR